LATTNSSSITRRLLVEKATLSPDTINILTQTAKDSSGSRNSVVNALYTLAGLGKLSSPPLLAALNHTDFGVRVHALRLSEPWLDRSEKVLGKVATMTQEPNPLVLIQLALTLGESRSEKASRALERLAKAHAELKWMKTAVESSKGANENDAISPQNLDHRREAAQQLASAKPIATDKQFTQTYERYKKALHGKRDPKKGEKLFRETCAACHLVRGAGKAVGPDLTGEKNRAEETMILDVLAPNREITAGYATHILTTGKGETLAGLLVAEAPGNVTLRDLAGNDQVILRKEIAKMETTKASLMPEGLEQVLSPKDLADLIAWLRE
jgi:putative heme-binding domain-containing protein